MPIDYFERHRRKKLKLDAERNGELLIEMQDKAAIRDRAISEFARQLDGKLANLQIDERLVVRFEIDIIDPGGRVRGGSGAQRNMPEYKEWRNAVFRRDDYTCQECGARGKIVAHHVQHWAEYPELRFEISNGLTLCNPCHNNKHPHLKL